jgi:hypothetical protein
MPDPNLVKYIGPTTADVHLYQDVDSLQWVQTSTSEAPAP